MLCGALTSVLMSGCSSPEEKFQALRQKYEKLNEKWKQCVKDNDKKCVDEMTRKGEELEDEMAKLRKERDKDPQFIKHKKELENNVSVLNEKYNELQSVVDGMELKGEIGKQLNLAIDKAQEAWIKRNEAQIELRKFVNE